MLGISTETGVPFPHSLTDVQLAVGTALCTVTLEERIKPLLAAHSILVCNKFCALLDQRVSVHRLACCTNIGRIWLPKLIGSIAALQVLPQIVCRLHCIATLSL